jgi:hypothetical protein
VGEFTVKAGQSVPFVLSYEPSSQSLPPVIDPFHALEHTEAFWYQWNDRCPDVGPWTETVKRSLITLKALTYAPTGGIVAAATTSLPEREELGLSLLLAARRHVHALGFMHLGYYDEARAWRDWLFRAVAAGRARSRSCTEWAGSDGYRNWSSLGCPAMRNPRRSGSATMHPGNCSSTCSARSSSLFQTLKAGPPEGARTLRPVVLEYLATAWREADEGI